MNKKAYFFLLLILLSSCTKELTTIELEKKKIDLERKIISLEDELSGIDTQILESDTGATILNDFIIETKKINKFGKDYILKKTGKLSSSQDINIGSNAIGTIESILVKEGDYVKEGQPLAYLDDSIGNYYINLKKSDNALDKARINYNSSKVSFDKQKFDTKVRIKKLKLEFDTFKKTTKETLKKAKNDLDNSITTNLESKSFLELEKLENSIKKQELDLDNKKISDLETINGFSNSLRKDQITLSIYLNDILEFSNNILGIDGIKSSESKKMKQYFGAKDILQKGNTKAAYINLRDFNDKILDNLSLINLSDKELEKYFIIISEGYRKSELLLSSLEESFNNSVVSIGALSNQEIDIYLGTINRYQSSYTINNSGFISFKNNINSFLKTYKLNYNSINSQIDLLKKDKNILIKSLDVSKINAQVGYDKLVLNSNNTINKFKLDIGTANNDLNNIEKTSKLTLQNLNNNIIYSQINQTQSTKEYSKLSIISPISGTIGTIIIDKGQDVNIGSQLFSIKSLKAPQVEFSITRNDLKIISEGTEIFYIDNNKPVKGRIHSISKVADKNLNYKVKAIFKKNNAFIGEIVNLHIKVKNKNTILPINLIKVDNNGKGLINVFVDGEIIQKQVTIGDIFGSRIEIKEKLNPKLDIIMTNIENFDKNKFKIKNIPIK